MDSQQFPYPHDPRNPGGRGLPYIPITLLSKHDSFQGQALLDSGAMINVLPYRVGLALGANWEHAEPIVLSGNLGQFPASILRVETQLGSFASQVLTYAWTRSNDAPIILGLFDFFWEFNVCFFASEGSIEIAPRRKNT